MSRKATARVERLASGPTTEQLERALAEALGRGPGVVRILERRPHAYRSTATLEEIRVRTGAGVEERLVFKDLGANGPEPVTSARGSFRHEPGREIEIYRDVLGPQGLSAPAFRAAVVRPRPRRAWLFVESVAGEPLWQRGDEEAWHRAAAWLAAMHRKFAGSLHGLPADLPVFDGTYFERWLERARSFVRWPDVAGRRGAPGGGGLDFAGLADAVARAVRWLSGQPVTFVHGEFYPSNVLVERSDSGPVIRPVDWEMAGLGCGLLDLAALTSGAWSDSARGAMAAAYREALPAALRPPVAELRRGLDRCRLLLAVHWLGYSDRWTPPPEQAHDWLATARELTAEVTA